MARSSPRDSAGAVSAPPDAPLPPDVAASLAGLAARVSWDGTAWSVGDLPAGSSANSLAETLYAGWYTQPATPPPSAADDPSLYRPSLLSALRAAHAAAATTSPGWTVTASDPRGVVSAVKENEARMLCPGEYAMPLRPGVPPAPGEPVEPVARLDRLDAERGIWWTFTDPAPTPPFGRLYFNARPATAPRVVHEITRALQSPPSPFPFSFCFMLKCPILATACQRVDAIVFYHPRPARDDILAALLARWSSLGPLLDPAVPALTCLLRPGLAWADDVDPRRSYGESRCHTIAAAIAGAVERWPAIDRAGRVAILVAALREAGIDPVRPWEVAP